MTNEWPPVKKPMKKWPFVLGGGLGVIGLVACVGVLTVAVSQVPNVKHSPGTSKASSAVVPLVEPSAQKSAGALTQNDVHVSLKQTEKHCFGSAGCNVVVVVKVSIDLDKLIARNKSYDLTYSIKGGTDGTVEGTTTLSPDGTYDSNQESVSTASKSTKLSVGITAFEENPY